MLVLSRGKNQTIEIGDIGLILTGKIRLTVVEMRGDKVRLGIEAAREIPVHRGEIYDRIHDPKLLEKSGENEETINADHSHEDGRDDDPERQSRGGLEGSNCLGNPGETIGLNGPVSGSGQATSV